MNTNATLKPGPKLLYVGRRNWRAAKSLRWVDCGDPEIQDATFVGEREINDRAHTVFKTQGGLFLAQPHS